MTEPNARLLPFDTQVWPDEVNSCRPRLVQTPWGELALHEAPKGLIAMTAWCPHMHGPLWEGSNDNGELVCPWHGWRYSLNDGGCTWTPHDENPCHSQEPLDLYQVEIGPQGTLQVLPPPAPKG